MITGTAEEFLYLLRGPNSKIWTKAFSNDLDRLAQGVSTRIPNGVLVFFMNKIIFPKHKKVTYEWVVSEINPHKEETFHVFLIVVGDCLGLNIMATTQCASLSEKNLMNSTISTTGGNYITIDLKDF